VCDGAVLTDANACTIIRAGSVVQTRPGPAPPEGDGESQGPAPPGSRGGGSLPSLSPGNFVKARGSSHQHGATPRWHGSGTLVATDGSGLWLPSQHLGDVGVHGAKALYGSRAPKAGPLRSRGAHGSAGADFGATRGSGAGAGDASKRGNFAHRQGDRHHHYSDGDTAPVTAASLGITVREMDGVVADDLALEDLSSWMNSYQSEVVSFSSSALNAELRYEEVLRSTAALGSPNAVRTRVVCQLLDAVVMRFGRFQRITQRLLHDVFASVFVDPNAPNAVPHFLRYARVANQYAELRGKHDLLLAEIHGEQGRSSKRWAYINRTLANMFKSQLVAGFRQWRLRAEENIANRELIQRMIVKWRKMDALRALYQWKHNAAACKQERSDAALDEMRAVNEELRQRLQKTEAERDIANMEITSLKEEAAAAATRLAVGQATNLDVVLELAAAQEECAALQTHKSAAHAYRHMLVEFAGARAAAAKAEVEAWGGRGAGKGGPRVTAVAADSLEKLVRWLNNQLARVGRESVSNLASDLQDGKGLAALMHACSPSPGEVPIDDIMAAEDPGQVAQFALDQAEALYHFPDGCIEAADILGADPAAGLALVAWMMTYNRGIDRDSPTQEALAACDAAVTAAAAAADRPDKEEVGSGGMPASSAAELMQAVVRAEAAVRDLHARREEHERTSTADAQDTMGFTFRVLIQKSKGAEVKDRDIVM